MKSDDENLNMAHRIASKVAQAGGSTYFVGGYVRDLLLGRPSKDIDIEVHGISVETLAQILDSLGTRTEMGASFGIMGLSHYDLDIAMPRRETATGQGHRDFAVCVDPWIGARAAALRRDFTCNALMQDVLSGEVLDFFGGLDDLKAGILRHVNDNSFGEDPLRVFRAAQFAARFKMQVAPETIALTRTMAVDALSHERVMGELSKALLKAQRPSVFFIELLRMQQLSAWFPELEALQHLACPAKDSLPNRWEHTLRALDEAAKLRPAAAHPLWLLLTALGLDIADLPNQANPSNPGEDYLSRLTNESDLLKYVSNLLALHRQPLELVGKASPDLEYMRLFNSCLCPPDLLLLCEAEYRAGCPRGERPARTYLNQLEDALQTLRQRLAQFTEIMARPFVQGRDLIAQGIRPGPQMTPALAFAHQLRLAGVPKAEALRQTLDYLNRDEAAQQ